MDIYDINARPLDFDRGQRVELHPGCDLWMRGARYGVVIGHTRNFVEVEMDHPQVSRRAHKFAPSLLRRV